MKAKFFAVLGVVIVIVIGILVLQTGGRLLDQWLDILNPFKAQPPTITFGDAIITDIQQVSELTTTIYSIQQVYERVYKPSGAFNDWEMIMVIKGRVEAGLDLNQLDASDISVSDDGKSITVNLPPVKILTERSQILSNNQEDTYFYKRWKDVASGAKLNEIEAEMRAEAGNRILESACNDNILQGATEDAKVTIEKFLKTTAPNYNITVVSAPVPSVEKCKAK